MRKIIFPLAAVLTAVLFTSCAGPERKLGRGVSNCLEVVRWGEMRRSIEQEALFGEPGSGCFGVIHGFDRSLQRTGLGSVEVATFPIPFVRPYYGPILTKSFAPDPVYPASYKPGLISDPMFDTDTYSGFSGGDIAPYMIGSRFQVFAN